MGDIFVELLQLGLLASIGVVVIWKSPLLIRYLMANMTAAVRALIRDVWGSGWGNSSARRNIVQAIVGAKSKLTELQSFMSWEKAGAVIPVLLILAVLGFGAYSIFSVASYVVSIPDRISAAAERGRRVNGSEICRNGYWVENDYSTRCATKDEKKFVDWLQEEVFFQ